MLQALHVRDFVIVEQATLDFEAGFTVLSGETGAGKSILIDALSLALGARGDSQLVRPGAERADITAVFEGPPSLAHWLAEHDIEGPALSLRRVLDAGGRSRAYINGRPVVLDELRALAGRLLDIHGQHAQHGLLHPPNQRALLDAQGGHTAQAAAVRKAWAAWQAARQALDEAQQASAHRAQRVGQLEQDVARLNALAPEPEEWAQLCARQTRLAHAQALITGTGQAIEALAGESASAGQALALAHQALQGLVRHDATLAAHCETLESARILCSEVVSSLNAYLDTLELDPDTLASTEARMSELFEAARRFQTDPEQLPELLESRLDQLATLRTGQDLGALEAACEQAEAQYTAQARKLSDQRRQTAQWLSGEVTTTLHTLAMAQSRFEVALASAPPSAHGLETVTFMVAGHPGAPARPLARVASGGELARISLALSVIASQAAHVPTLIFDEVDAGIGGAVAEVVGRLLRELGKRHQVLCVTHLPQVAACAHHQFRVDKAVDQGQPRSRVQLLSPAERVSEIARMLGGLTLTEATRDHAREMLRLSAT